MTWRGHVSVHTPRGQSVQADVRMQDSLEPQSQFSLHLSRLVRRLKSVSCFGHSDPSCVTRDHDTEVVHRETLDECETLPEY